MKVNKEQASPGVVKLTISGDSTDLEPIRRHTVKHFAAQIKVPGFRLGQAPAAMVEKHINQQQFADEFMEHALNHLYQAAFAAEKLKTFTPPKISLKKFVPYTLLEFEAEIEVLGRIDLPDYKKIKLAKQPVAVAAEEVNGVLKNLQQRAAKRKTARRAAKTGDEVIIDFSGKDKAGAPVKGADGKDYPLVIGSQNFIPGFEDNLIGLMPGEAKEFTIKFPSDYGVKDMQNMDVTFEVRVTAVNEVEAPKLDDKFAATVGSFKTLSDLKKDVKRQLTAEKQAQANQQFENELIKSITDQTKLEIPKTLVDEEIRRLEETEKSNLMYRGQTWQEHLKAEGITEEEHFERQRPVAEERIKAGFVLSEIAEKEELKVTQGEIDSRIVLLKSQHQDPAMQGELDKPENQREIESRLLAEKTIQKLVDYASK